MPTNTSVYTGADGSISLAAPEGPNKAAFQKILEDNGVLTVGRAQNVQFEMHSVVLPYHELGQRYATELRAGNITVRGTIGRAFLNGALIRLMLGDTATNGPGGPFAQPTYNITLQLQNASAPDNNSHITLHEVKMDSYAFTMPEDDFVMESVGFQALYVTVEDKAK